MAAGGVTDSRRTFHLPISRISVMVTEGSLVETSAQAVATGEDPSLGGYGTVSQLLIKSCPQTYKRAREELKKNTKKFEFGKVYPCPFPNPATGGKAGMSFNVVLHAVIPAVKLVKEKEWTEQMKMLYYNLLKAANNLGKSSLALPLLGSGQAGASIDTAVDTLVHALTTFQLKDDRQCLWEIILYARKEAFSKMCSKLEASLKTQSDQLNGVLPTQQLKTRPGSSRGKTRPSSSPPSSRGRNPGSIRGAGRGGQKSRGNKKKGAALARPAQQSCSDDMSNMYFILNGLTLDSKRRQEEDMDCSEEIYPVNNRNDDGDYDEDDDDDDDEDEEEERCPICLDVMLEPKKLDKCGHTFCKDCIESSFQHHKPVCPNCNTVYGVITGNQPYGTMDSFLNSQSLPGYEHCGQIIINYSFPSGIQGPEHPNPGQPFHGTDRQAFLPDCTEGRKVYRLLRVAFEKRLTFTIGRSVTTGYDNVVTWNDIHHKTRPYGGSTGFGYPDPHYLSRVQEELAAKGITETCLQGRVFDL